MNDIHSKHAEARTWVALGFRIAVKILTHLSESYFSSPTQEGYWSFPLYPIMP